MIGGLVALALLALIAAGLFLTFGSHIGSAVAFAVMGLALLGVFQWPWIVLFREDGNAPTAAS